MVPNKTRFISRREIYNLNRTGKRGVVVATRKGPSERGRLPARNTSLEAVVLKSQRRAEELSVQTENLEGGFRFQ